MLGIISKFPMGKIVMTRGVNDEIAGNANFSKLVLNSLKRHAQCDWGDLSEQDTASNDSALKNGDRLFSAYMEEGLKKIWIITEWDRSVTTILFPDEY
jgi:hypothetical protein